MARGVDCCGWDWDWDSDAGLVRMDAVRIARRLEGRGKRRIEGILVVVVVVVTVMWLRPEGPQLSFLVVQRYLRR